MSLIYMNGFDHSNNSTDGAKEQAPFSGQTCGLRYARGGVGQGLLLANRISARTLLRVGPPIEAYQTLIIGFALKIDGVGITNTPLCSFYSDNFQTQQVTLRVLPNGALQVGKGDGTTALVGCLSDARTINPNVWNYIEFKCSLSDAPAVANGIVSVKVNGQFVFDILGDGIVTGVVTRNSGSDTVYDTVALLGPSSGQHFFDDVYLLNGGDSGVGGLPNNDFIGDIVVRTVLPNGMGAQSTLGPALTSSSGGANNTNVDELAARNIVTDAITPPAVPNITDYNFSADGANTANDLYTFGDITVPVGGTIFGIQVNACVVKSDSGIKGMKHFIRCFPGLSEIAGDRKDVSDLIKYLSWVYQVNPNDNLAWTESGFNGTEFGIMVVD